MALSGNVVTTAKEGRSVTLQWTATQSIEKNTSTISWKLVGSGSYTGYVAVYGIKININGSQVYYRDSSSRTNCYPDTVLCSGTTTIPHNSDGTKTFSISVDAAIYTNSFGCTGSGSFTLNTIPRASTPSVSASSVDMGNAITISISRASSSFTHTLEYKFGSATGTIGTGIATSKSWTVPLSLANQVPSSTSGTCTITCKTYNGSTLIGTKTVTFTAKVPTSIVPSISTVATSDPTGNLARYGGYVQNKSKVKANVTASGSYSSTIKAYSIVMNGTTYTANGSESGVLKTSGTNTIKATVTDSRGRTATKSVTISVLAYTNPTISSFTVTRCDADGTANADGAYMKAVFKASITALNNNNSKSIVLKYKDATASSWNDAATYSDYTVDNSMIISADVDHSYNVMLTVADDFASASSTKDLGTAFTLMDFNASGKGISFGKVSEKDAFEVNMTSYMNSIMIGLGRSIYQMQNSTSNYTQAIRWWKGGESQGKTYDPHIGHHNTGNTTGAICIVPYATDTAPWNGGNVGLYVAQGILKFDGVDYSPYKIGDTVTITSSSKYFTGLFSTVNSNNAILFTFPLSRKMGDDITGINITSLTGQALSVEGKSINGSSTSYQWVGKTGMIVKHYAIDKDLGTITIYCSNPTAFTNKPTNNTMIMFTLRNLTFTFT